MCEMSLRGILRGFGLKVGRTTKAGFASRIMELTEHHPALTAIAKALLAVHEVLLKELNGFDEPGAQTGAGRCPHAALDDGAGRWPHCGADLCCGH